MSIELFEKANKLLRDRKYAESLQIYRNLHRETGRDVYKKNIEFIERRLRNRRILICTNGVMGPTAAGGIATAMTNLAHFFRKKDYDVTILYCAHPYYSLRNYGYWRDEYSCKYDIQLAHPDLDDCFGTQEMKRSYLALKFLLNNEFRLCVFHDYQGLGYYATLAKKIGFLKDTKILINGHGNLELSYHFGKKIKNQEANYVTRYMESQSILNSDIFVAPSQSYIDFWEASLETKLNSQRVKNLYYPDISYSMKELYSSSLFTSESRSDNKYIVYYFYSRIEVLKGIDLFIEFAKIKHVQNPNKYKFSICGVQTTIGDIKSSDYVALKLAGSGVRYEVILNPNFKFFKEKIKKDSGILIFPTLGENSPYTVVEALSEGISLLASDIPGILELINEDFHKICTFKTGILDDLINKSKAYELEKIVPKLSQTNEQIESDWLKKLRDFIETDTPTFQKSECLKVSVIIPTIGRIHEITECLVAFKKQTYKYFQLIVVDDSVEGNCDLQNLCDVYSVVYARNNKRYKGGAINSGAEMANGDILSFFDDDDIPTPTYLASVAMAFSHSKYDVLSTFCRVFDDATSNSKHMSLSLGGGLEQNLKQNYFGKGCLSITREAFDRVGGVDVDREPIPLVDYRFYLKCYLLGLSIAVIPTEYYFYRRNSNFSLYEKWKDPQIEYKARREIFDVFSRYSKDNNLLGLLEYFSESVFLK